MGAKQRISVASCLFLAIFFAGLFLQGCERTSRNLVRHPIESHGNGVDIKELYYIRHGHLPLIPYVKWMESNSILGDSAREGKYRESLRLVYSYSSHIDSLNIRWNLYEIEGLGFFVESGAEVNAVLDSATEFIKRFGLIPNDAATIDVVLVPKGMAVSSKDRFYYVSRPHFRFYSPVEGEVSGAWVESLYPAIFTVFHEMVHYRTWFDGRYAGANFADIREEVAAYAAGECGKVWLAQSSDEFEVIAKRRSLPDGSTLRRAYKAYGPSVSGQIMANRLVFSIYPESKSQVVPKGDFPTILNTCRAIINVGSAVIVSPTKAFFSKASRASD